MGQVIRPFHDVSHDIKCSYMFIYNPEEFVQEAISMITEMTIDNPTSPLRKKNRQEEYLESDDEPVIDEACKKLIREYRNIEEQKDKLQSIKPNLRTDEEKAQMNSLKQKLSRLKKKLITNYPQYYDIL